MTPNREQNRQILERFSLYTEAAPSVQAQMVEAARVERLTRDSYYFREEESPTFVGLVEEGSLRVFKSGQGGREVTLFHVEAGEACVLNLLSILGGRRFPATSVVEISGRALMLPANEFREWFGRDPSVRDCVLDLISARFGTLMNLIDEIAFDRMDRRLSRYLLARFGKPSGSTSLRLTHDEIARHLGSAREVIGRLLKELERDGAIALSRGSIRLIDPTRLRELESRPPVAARTG